MSLDQEQQTEAIVPLKASEDWCPEVWDRVHKMTMKWGGAVPMCEFCGQIDSLALLHWATDPAFQLKRENGNEQEEQPGNAEASDPDPCAPAEVPV